MSEVRRRQFLIGAGVLFVAPLASLAQQEGKVRRIGFLALRSRSTPAHPDVYYDAFVQGMRELGYIENKNLIIEWRFADGKFERLPSLAAELVQLKVEVIVTAGSQAISALQKATATIPIVFANAGDPVSSGFVASLARPGGNITGRSNLLTDINPKQLELLLTIRPKLSRVAVLLNPSNSYDVAGLKSIESAARGVDVEILPVEAGTTQEIDRAFPTITRENADAVIVLDDGFLIARRRQIADLAVKNRLPSIFSFRVYVEAGGLVSYGPNIPEQYRHTASLVDKIFKGAKPAELPVEQPTNFELLINLRTAQALGIKFPQSLLERADEVIR